MHLLFPRTHREWIQRHTFLRRDPRAVTLTDKIEAKKYIAERVGRQYVIPSYRHGRRLPPLRRSWADA
jgi:hypothetical protein